MYLNANISYRYSMSKPLPYKNFMWSNDLTLDPNNLQTGIYEVDIETPKELQDEFVDYPLAPEIKKYRKICYLNIKNT